MLEQAADRQECKKAEIPTVSDSSEHWTTENISLENKIWTAGSRMASNERSKIFIIVEESATNFRSMLAKPVVHALNKPQIELPALVSDSFQVTVDYGKSDFVIAPLFDLSKAFDCLNHEFIKEKILKIIRIIQSWLHENNSKYGDL